MRERPSEEEAEATLAAGLDMEVDDGQRSHLQLEHDVARRPQPPPAAESRTPPSAVAIDMPTAEPPFATHRRMLDDAAASSEQATSPVSLASPGSELGGGLALRAGSALSEGSSDGEMPDADAAVQNYAGTMVRTAASISALSFLEKHRMLTAICEIPSPKRMLVFIV